MHREPSIELQDTRRDILIYKAAVDFKNFPAIFCDSCLFRLMRFADIYQVHG